MENTKGITGQSVHKEITHQFNHPSQLKPGIEMGVIPAEVLPGGAKGIKWSEIKEDCWTSGILHDGTVEHTCIILQEKGRMTPKAIQRS